jgi:alkylhydroperoxidase/carboxymuconolactone decarboxylase family protein YurZ
MGLRAFYKDLLQSQKCGYLNFRTSIKNSNEKETYMQTDPLDIFKTMDPELMEIVSQSREFTFKDGALPAKMKYLIAVALDAAHGATEGVKALSLLALKHGATKEEVFEALHVANFVSGAGSVYTGARALMDVF